MTLDTDERSVQNSRPRDAYEFVLPAVTYRLTSGVKDLVVGGQTYHAGVIGRAEAEPTVVDGSQGELEIMMTASHPIARACLSGTPPRIDVTIRRCQLTSGEYEYTWAGRVVAASAERNSVTLLCAQHLSIALSRRLPTITVGRQCAHVLFDSACTVARSAFRVTTTIAHVDGRDVTVDDMDGQSDQWAKFGELVHLASGERVDISSQIGNDLELQLRIPMQVGDDVEIYAGCAHDIDICRTKFANHTNFGGLPDHPATSPFTVNGYAVFRPVY
jgi:uncharacterized phage protein (TIGR02218 family)